MLNGWNSYPEVVNLFQALEICSHYLFLRTVILSSGKAVGAPDLKIKKV